MGESFPAVTHSVGSKIIRSKMRHRNELPSFDPGAATKGMRLGRICGEDGRLKTFGVLVEGILRTTNIFVQGTKRWGIEGIY